MTKKIFLIVIFVLLITLVSADVVWNEPVQVCQYTNIEFYGSSLKTSDGYTLLIWNDTSEVDQRGYVQKYSENMTPQWNQPVILDSYFSFFHVVETSDGNYLFLVQEGYTFRTFKISPAGVHLWNQSSVVAVQNAGGTQCGIVVKADNAGGAYIFWVEAGSSSHAVLQHIDINGNRTIGDNGAVISDQDAYDPQLIVQPDNHAVIFYRMYGTITFKQVNTIGTMQWTQSIPCVVPANLWARVVLAKSVNGSFYLSICTRDSLVTQKYTTNGNAVWLNPYVISRNTGYDYFADSIQSDLSDDTLILLWQSDNRICYTQKISSDGFAIWDSTGVRVFHVPESSVTKLARDNNGGCFISGYTDYPSATTNKIYAQYVSSQGIPLPDSIDVRYTDKALNFVMHCQNNIARFFYFDQRNYIQGLYYQCMDSDGNLLVSEENTSIETGDYGRLTAIRIQPKQDGCVAIWLKTFENDKSVIYYDFFATNGNSVFVDGPRLLVSGGEHRIYDLKALTTTEGYTLVSWYESDIGRIRAQLLDIYGNTLWGETGEIVCSASLYGPKYYLMYENGALYFVWSSRDSNLHFRVYGQKYISGTALWPLQGLQLTFDNPADPSIQHYIIDFNKRYILFHDNTHNSGSSGNLHILQIDENGLCLPPFNSYGNQLANFENPSWEGQIFHSCFEYQNSLFTQFHYVRWVYDEVFFVERRMQKSNLTGAQLFGPTGQVNDVNWNVSNINEVLYGFVKNQYSFAYSQLDSDFNTIVLTSYDTGNSFISLYRLESLSNGRFLVVFYTHDNYGNGNHSIRHIYINSNGTFSTPANSIISSSSVMTDLSSCKNDSRIYVIWTEGNSGSSLYIQQLTDGVVINDDEYTSFDSQIRLHNTYPNPFTKTTSISIETEQPITCELSIYNTKGQLVKTLRKGKLDKGITKLDWDGRDKSEIPCASGVYLYSLKSGEQTYTKKMLKIQ